MKFSSQGEDDIKGLQGRKMRAKHTGQDLGQTLIFTYKHQRDCLTDIKRQKGVGATVSQHITLIGTTVSEVSTLIEEAKKKIKEVGTRLATMKIQTQTSKQRKTNRTKGKW